VHKRGEQNLKKSVVTNCHNCVYIFNYKRNVLVEAPRVGRGTSEVGEFCDVTTAESARKRAASVLPHWRLLCGKSFVNFLQRELNFVIK
jgi:hypothetical protein